MLLLDKEIAVGSVIVTVVEFEQPPASCTVIVYVPADNAFCVVPVNPPGAQEYVNAPEPPLPDTTASPSFAPLHEIFCDETNEIEGPPFEFTVAEAVA